MIWVHVIHVLGMLGLLGVCNMLEHPLAHASHMLRGLMWEVTGAKHDKAKENNAKLRLRIQNCGNIKTIQQF